MTDEMNPPPAEPGTGRYSLVRLRQPWYIAAESGHLRSSSARPLTVTVLGTAMALFRGARGAPAAFLDRCPHRNVPLSLGRVRGGELQCAYHGWRFASDGRCVQVPGRARQPAAGEAAAQAETAIRGHAATVFACVEQDGYIWVRPAAASGAPLEPPPRIPGIGDPGYGIGRLSYEIEAPLHATLENILDVPHTAFLHGGLFRRSDKRREIEVVVRRRCDRVEAEYIGEARPSGLAGMLLAPGGGEVRHFDRFLMPSIAQVEYSLGERSRLIATHLLTPVDDMRTRGFLVVAAKLPIPLWLIRGAFRTVALKLLRQDQVILKAQAENVRRFGGERFASTEIDVLGSQIWWLLRRAEREEHGLAPEGEEAAPDLERRFRMLV